MREIFNVELYYSCLHCDENRMRQLPLCFDWNAHGHFSSISRPHNFSTRAWIGWASEEGAGMGLVGGNREQGNRPNCVQWRPAYG